MRLRALVICQEHQGNWPGGNCFAKVDILRTPKGQLNALVTLVDSHNLLGGHPTEQWKAALMNRLQQRNQQEGDVRMAEAT